jgi:uncharacterized membrane protein
METLNLIYGTILLRPYVFIFLAFYLAIAVLHMGWVRTIIFSIAAYTIAFTAEYSSTRNGFPFGFYSYIDVTRNQELWISNVPFMDSLSFTFLSFISYLMALILWSPLKTDSLDMRIIEKDSIKYSHKVILTSAFLMMLLDVVIDPVAFLGDRWFLGKIYYYQEEGEYFNIPLTNFAGWFIVGSAILYSFISLTKGRTLSYYGKLDLPYQGYFAPALYFGVLLFNLAVTFYIGEFILGFCGIALTTAILSLMICKIRNPEKFAN